MECTSCGVELDDDNTCATHPGHCQDCCPGTGEAVEMADGDDE